MTSLGLGLVIFTFISIILVFVLNRYIKKFLIKNYYIWFSMGIFSLAYFFAFRYSYDVSEFIQLDMTNLKSFDLYTYSFRWSKILLLDLCPFAFAVLNLSLVFDKTRNFAKIVAPYSILGGLVTMVSSIPKETLDSNVSLFEYIFVGQDVNKMFFIMHYWAIILGILVLLNSRTYTRWSILSCALFFLYFLAYVLICISALGITNNATGLAEGDWYNYLNQYFWFSQYQALYKFVPLPYQAEIALWYTVSGLIIIFQICLKNTLTKNSYLISKNYLPWYIGNKFFFNLFVNIDFYINKKIRKIKSYFKKDKD